MERHKKLSIFRNKFYGRQDVHGRQWESVDDKGKPIKGFVPKCENFWTPGCHIKLKDNVPCSKCEIKKYEPVSDNAINKHIDGFEPILIYLVQDDGSTKFFAFDFDLKPGKEDKGYTFEDVSVVSKLLHSEGIDHGIARSTGMGFHIYVFLDKFYPAARSRALSFWVFERCGFMEQMRLGIRPLPECFPKQSYLGFGPGNGIKPPMIETRFPQQRNGFVDAYDNFIPDGDQWEYLESIPYASTEVIDSVIAKYGIEVDETPATTVTDATRRALTRGSSKGGWQQPLTGSFEKVIEGCAAVRRVFAKAATGVVPGHQEGFSIYHLAMQCVDGLDIFKSRLTGWGSNDKDLMQLQHSLDKNYQPWTCKKMQEQGVCIPGTKCFEKKPPLIVVEGLYVPNTGIPESEWPDPSPIRYAYGKGEDFLEKLKKEVDNLVGEENENLKGNKLRDIAKRSQVFDEDQQRALKEHIKTRKIIKATEIHKMFGKATSEYSKEYKEKLTSRSDVVNVGKNFYRLCDTQKGYLITKPGKDGIPVQELLCNCVIEIDESCTYLDDNITIKEMYKGRLVSDTKEIHFEVLKKDWWDANKFLTFFGTIAGGDGNFLRIEVDNIRQASVAFSERRGIKQNNYLVTQGWYQGSYIMPNVLIDSEGIKPNTEKIIDLSVKPHANYLDFKILSDDDFRSVGFHIMNDFLNAWPRAWSFICISHALLPILVEPVNIKKRPILFLEGLTGSGKTELLHTIQYFWGEFESLVNLSSTGKGLMAVAHDFKDSLVVFDDYKGLNSTQLSALQNMIQYSYDPNSAVKLNRDSSLKQPKQSRGIIAFTGEHFIENDAALVARTILLEVNKQDTSKTKEKYLACIKNRHLYSGFTPRFVEWFIRQDSAKIKEDYDKLQSDMHADCSSKQNADRISSNCALNHLVWKLFVYFMDSYNLVSDVKTLIEEHLVYINQIKNNMLARCVEDQNGLAFLRILSQLISTGEVVIEGFNSEDDNKHKPVIGFISRNENGVKICNLYPDMTIKHVKNNSRDAPIRGTSREFGNQFYQAGMLADVSPERFQKQVRYNGSITRVWPFELYKLGLYTGDLEVIQGGKVDKIIENPRPVIRPDGTF